MTAQIPRGHSPFFLVLDEFGYYVGGPLKMARTPEQVYEIRQRWNARCRTRLERATNGLGSASAARKI